MVEPTIATYHPFTTPIPSIYHTTGSKGYKDTHYHVLRKILF